MRRPVVAAALAALLLAGPAPGARAEGLASLPALDDATVAASVSALDAAVADLDLGVAELTLNVTPLEATRKESGQEVVTLAADILFGFGRSDMASAAQARIAELVKPIPQGAAVQVHGHTDRIGTDATNQALSQARAQAVAAVIAKARPDLDLDVQGFGKTRPVADNGTPEKDNPEGRMLNRRVEVRYAG